MDLNVQKKCGSCSRVFKSDEDFLVNTFRWRLCNRGNLWLNCECGSTLFLEKDTFPWYSSDLGMSEEAKSLFNSLNPKESLPYVPFELMNIHQALENEVGNISQLAKLVKRDPIFSLEIISTYEGLRRCQNKKLSLDSKNVLEYALTFLGLQHIQELLLLAMVKQFEIDTRVFSTEEFWHHSKLTGEISVLLADFLTFDDSFSRNLIYIIGRCCDIGKLVGAMIHPEKIDEIQNTVNDCNNPMTWEVAEIAVGYSDHSILGEVGAVLWGFPTYVSEAIRFHHNPPSAKIEVHNRELCHLMCLADAVAHWVDLEPHRMNESRVDEGCQYFNITRKELDTFVEKITKTLAENPSE